MQHVAVQLRRVVGQTARVGWVSILAGQDVLQALAKGDEIDALAEQIWNGLDAEADVVEVEFETSNLGPGDSLLDVVVGITVRDNGHGMSSEVANRAFPLLGDSWKKTLNGRTVNGRRVLHGSRGQGRFRAYVLGNEVEWSSVAKTDAKYERVVISGNLAHIGGFTISDPEAAPAPPGTVVKIRVDQERGGRQKLLADDAANQLAIRLAPHLLGNTDLTVLVGGTRVETTQLIDGAPIDVSLDALDPAVFGGREVPVLTIIDWNDRIRSAPGLFLCSPTGAALVQVENSSPHGTVKSTGYLKWSGFSEAGAELTLAGFGHTAIIQEAQAVLDHHFRQRMESLKATIVATLKAEGSYPFADHLDPVSDATRQVYDLVVVTARTALQSVNRSQRAMSAKLLRLALESRPENLEEILTETLKLTADEREQLADMLRISSLPAIIGAASEVANRLDLISALRHLVYGKKVSDEMREVDQLHPLVKDSIWLFGEEWRLAQSEAGLTTVLRDVAKDKAALEVDLIKAGGSVRLPDNKRGRVDLLLQRVLPSPTKTHRLVIELKRPSVPIGKKELQQTKDYATALLAHPGAGPCQWEFWAIGSDTKPDIALDLEPTGLGWGHVIHHADVDVYVTTWSRLLDDAQLRYTFYRERLGYEVNQEAAIERVRKRHAEWLPPAKPGVNG